jgi:hypothetical protein
MMHEAQYFNIAFLPDSAKQAIEQRLLSATVNQKTYAEFKKIIEFMYGTPGTNGKELCQEIQLVDRRRNQDFSTVEPEMAKLINYCLGN